MRRVKIILYNSFLSLPLLLCFIFTDLVKAQDIHFSMPAQNFSYMNPAQTGIFDESFRLFSSYRYQYKSIPVPYTTFLMGFDAKISLLKGLSAGALLFNDKSGDSRQSTSSLQIPLSYKLRFHNDTSQAFYLGLKAGVVSRSIHLNGLSFDSQFDGDRYDPTLDPGENFARTSFVYADFSAGVMYSRTINKRKIVKIGFGVDHLNKPSKSFFSDAVPVQSVKINFLSDLTFKVSDRADVSPLFSISLQNKFKNILTGSWFRYWYPAGNGVPVILSAGLFTRTGDALVSALAFKQGNLQVSLSYDISYGPVSSTNNNRGGTEVNLIYLISKPKPIVIKKRYCPEWL